MKYLLILLLLSNICLASTKDVWYHATPVHSPKIGDIVEIYTKSFPVPLVNKESMDCLVSALVGEAEVRLVEEDISMIAIAEVVLNRTQHNRFPDTVCGVIQQKIKGYCIFSFYCLTGHSSMKDIRRYRIAYKVAYRALQGHYRGSIGLDRSILFYKRCDTPDKWFERHTIFQKRIRSHCFYSYRK